MLRPADHKDLDFVQTLLDRPENLDRLGAYTRADLAAALEDTDNRIWLWHPEVSRAPQGFIWLRGVTDPSVKIEELAVDTPGTGAGAALMHAVLHWADSATPRRALWLYVAGDNTAAIRFYDRLGFSRGALRPKAWARRKGPPADVLRMDRARP